MAPFALLHGTHSRFKPINTLAPPVSAVVAPHVFCRFAAMLARLYSKMHRRDYRNGGVRVHNMKFFGVAGNQSDCRDAKVKMPALMRRHSETHAESTILVPLTTQ